MSRMFRTLDLFVLSCLFLPVISATGEIPPPLNFKLQWINDFKPNLSWTPQGSNCNYTVERTYGTGEQEYSIVNTSYWSEFTILGGRSLSFNVTTDCYGTSRKWAVYNISYPELVENVDCYLYARGKSRCQWNATSHATDVRFFYRLKDEVTTDKSKLWSKFQECSSYIRNASGVRTGCELEATDDHVIYISFNESVNSKPARNTFEIILKDNVKPPPLTWKVVQNKDNFSISWKAPDILDPSDWKYKIRYTKCDKPEEPLEVKQKETYVLARDSDCQYRIAIRADVETGGEGETPWSADEYFGKDLDPLVYVAVIIPCVVTVLVALMLVCCRRNKDKFFPPILTPVDFITDIDNNNKSNLYNLQSPADEEQTCEVTVLDPEIVRLDC